MRCDNCGRDLVPDEIGMTRKLINRAAEKCFCYTCLAKRFRVSESRLKEKADEYRTAGCALFSAAAPEKRPPEKRAGTKP